MLTLFAHPLSPHARKAHFVLEESGQPYTYQLVDLAKSEQKSAQFLARNPVGKVPVLQDGDFQLPESGAILRYVAENYAPGKLIPEDRQQRAKIDQWLFWQPGEANQILHKPFQIKMFAMLAGKQPDEAAFQRAVQDCEPVLKHVDEALADRQYIVGDALSIADIALVESIFQMHVAGAQPPSQFANLHRWFANLSERPAFKKTRPNF